jgi:hypothetical protein
MAGDDPVLYASYTGKASLVLSRRVGEDASTLYKQLPRPFGHRIPRLAPRTDREQDDSLTSSASPDLAGFLPHLACGQRASRSTA